jgi:hypothetical protein
MTSLQGDGLRCPTRTNRLFYHFTTGRGDSGSFDHSSRFGEFLFPVSADIAEHAGHIPGFRCDLLLDNAIF